MHLTYYGHSCFEVEVAGKRLLLDPFITPNPLAEKIDVSKIKPDYIFLSHVETIARQSGAILVGSFEVMNWFQKKGLEKIFPMNVGGSYHFEFGCVTMTNAIHSSSMPDGSYGGQPGGFLIKTAEGSFYYSGDTGLTHDMKLIAAMVIASPWECKMLLQLLTGLAAKRLLECITILFLRLKLITLRFKPLFKKPAAIFI